MDKVNSARIDAISRDIALRDPELKRIFQQCLKEIWENDFVSQPDGGVIVSSTHKKIMTLRESTALTLPLCLMSREDAALQVMIHGVIDKQFQMILEDPYANSFKVNETEPAVHERNFTLDALLSPIQLIWSYWQSTEDDSIFDETALEVFRTIFNILTVEQHHNEFSEYQIETDEKTEGKMLRTPAERQAGVTGLIWSAYRPGGEPCELNYHIPSQMSAVMTLNYLVDIFRDIYLDQDASEDVILLQENIDKGIQQYGIVDHPDLGQIYAYETDGLGNYAFLDEADFPNLLSIPYLGYVPVEDSVYQNTRRFIFSKQNPNFIQGKSVAGLGGYQQGKSYISPISIIMRGLTTEDPLEIEQVLDAIKESQNGTYQIRGRIDPDNPLKSTSEKSDIAGALFLELTLMKLAGLY